MALPADRARLGFAARQALVCALTAWVGEVFQTPEIALTVYLVFFLNRVDRASSLVANIVMTLLITIIIVLVVLTTMIVIDQPALRFVSVGLLSFALLFLASASKLRPIGAMVALIAGYALDMLGSAHAGEVATRALLYAWLFIGIPAGVSVVVNLVLAPAPRRLIEAALAYRLEVSARRWVCDDPQTIRAFKSCLAEGPGEIAAWLRMLAIEKSTSTADQRALRQAQEASVALIVMTDVATQEPLVPLSAALREGVSAVLAQMATILRSGRYPLEIDLKVFASESELPARARILIAQLRATLREFTEVAPEEQGLPKVAESGSEKAPPQSFFLPDAFSNPQHLHYAFKTTLAALFCYVLYSILNWPGIHTCFITCYIVALPTAAESIQKLMLRIIGCVAGAAIGIATLIFVMPGLDSIAELLVVVSIGAFAAAWIAGGSPGIAYAGFQVAFAFFLSVIQGPSPAFDMAVARDRVVGILIGIVVSYAVSGFLWPVSVSRRFDSQLSAVLRQMSRSSAAPSAAVRRGVGAVALAGLHGLGQDLDLLSFEPRSLRPPAVWEQCRRQMLDCVAALVGPLLLSASDSTALGAAAAGRLEAVASRLSPSPAGSQDPTAPAIADGSNRFLWQWLQGPLVALEDAVAAAATAKARGDEHATT